MSKSAYIRKRFNFQGKEEAGNDHLGSVTAAVSTWLACLYLGKYVLVLEGNEKKYFLTTLLGKSSRLPDLTALGSSASG